MKKQNAFFWLFCFGACALLAAWQGVEARRTGILISSARRELEIKQAENSHLVSEISLLKSSGRLENAAKTIGLAPAEPEAIITLEEIPPAVPEKPKAWYEKIFAGSAE